MSKFVGFVVGAAMVAIGIATGNPALIIQGGAMILSNAVMLLTAPKTPARQASEMAIQLGEQPRSMLVGEAFTAGSLVDGFNYGGKYGTDWEVLVIRLADHKCDGLTGFYVNDEYVPYTGNGNYPQFDGTHFRIYFRGDTSVDPLPDVVVDEGPGWLVTDIGESGCDVTVCYLSDPPDAKKPAWPGGRPRFGFVVRGKLCYDPRLDDTVTGGSGPHRWTTPSTWEWSENAAVVRYNWVRGVFANDEVADPEKLLVGRGLTAEEAPPENIIAAANLCDELEGENLAYESYSPQTPGLDRLWGFTFSPDFRKFIAHSLGSFEVWDTAARARLVTGTFSANFNSNTQDFTGFASDGTVYLPNDARTGIYNLGHLGQGTEVLEFATPTDQQACVVRRDGDGVEHICTIPYSSLRTFYIDGVAWDPDTTGETWGPDCFVTDGYGDIWAVGSRKTAFVSATKVCFWRVVNASGRAVSNFAAVTVSGSASGGGICAALHYAPTGQWIVSWDLTNLYAIDDTSFAIDDTQAFVPDTWNVKKQFANYQPGQSSIYLNPNGATVAEIDLATLSTLRTLTVADWAATDADGVVYSPVNHALIAGPQLDDETNFLFLDRNGSYRVAGPIYSNQDHIEVEGMFAAATGGTIVTREGSVELEPGAAKSISFTFTDDDLIVGSKVSWNQGFLSEADGEWLNTVVANYVEPEQKWASHNTPPVRDVAQVLADGRVREAQISLRLVRYREQALRIAEIQRRLARLWGRATVTLGPRFCEVEDGDWGQWQSARHGFTMTCRVEAYHIDEKWHNTLTLREIAASAYAADGVFAQEQSRPAPILLPTPIGAPAAGNWTLTPTTLDSAGASVPALVIDGTAADDGSAEAIIVEYWLDDGVLDPVADPDDIPWIMVGRYPPSTERIEVAGLTGGETYYVALTYVVSGIPGDRLVVGPETVADLDISPQVTAGIAAAVLDDLADVTAPTPADGDVLTFDATGVVWMPAAPGAGGGGVEYMIDRLFSALSTTSFAVNSTSYMAPSDVLRGKFDTSLWMPDYFRILLFGQSSEAGQTATVELRTEPGGAALHSGGNDLVVSNTGGYHDSGWLTVDTALSGFQDFRLYAKGSNGTVDLNARWVTIMWK